MGVGAAGPEEPGEPPGVGDDDGRGEILVKGPHVFQGYHGLEKETDESFEDGWFKTGDLGTIAATTERPSLPRGRGEEGSL